MKIPDQSLNTAEKETISNGAATLDTSALTGMIIPNLITKDPQKGDTLPASSVAFVRPIFKV